MTVKMHFQHDVAVLDLGDGENQFSLEWLQDVENALDKVEGWAPTALITTGGGKFYSSGLDLEWLMANPHEHAAYVTRVHALLSRVLTIGVPTVAAVNGHAFGAGAMLATAHDFRLMREDRGYFCFPEVDIKVPFTEGMAALIQAKLTPASAVEAMTTGRRYGGPEAQAAGLVDAVATDAGLLDAAVAVAQPLARKDPQTLGSIKATMFAGVVASLARSR